MPDYFLERITNAGGTILDTHSIDGASAVLMQASQSGGEHIRIITYDSDEAQHEGAECVIEIRAFYKTQEREAREVFKKLKLSFTEANQ